MQKKCDWWQDFFDERYMQLYDARTDGQNTTTETNFIKDIIGDKKCPSILDIACGFGRHSIMLAQHSASVVGVDYSEYMVHEARKRAKEKKVSVEFLEGDMRNLPVAQREFDFIIQMFSSFGYFDSQLDDMKVLRNVADVLKPNGRYILDLNNALRLIFIIYKNANKQGGDIPEFSYEKTIGRLKVLHNISVDSKIMRVSLIREWLDRKKVLQKYQVHWRIYTYLEIESMLQCSGLEIENVYGDYDGGDFTYKSPRMILVVRHKRHS